MLPMGQPGVACDQIVKRPLPIRFLAKGAGAHAVTGVALALNHHRRPRRAAVEDDRRSDHPLFSDGGDFHHVAIFEHGDDRAEASAREVDVLNRLAGLVKNVFEDERDNVERGRNPLVNLGRESGEEPVLDRRRTIFSGRRAIR